MPKTVKELINELNNWLLNSDNIPKYIDDLVDEILEAYEKELAEKDNKLEIQKKIINEQHEEILNLKDNQLFKEDFYLFCEEDCKKEDWLLKDNSKFELLDNVTNYS